MAANGADRRRFAREIEDRQVQLMRRDPALTALEAFRLAAQQVSKERPELLAAYRGDSVTLGR
jgi:hypothetical protein